jgi:hypothetical protein
VLSDFLSGKNKSLSITSDLMQGRSASDLAEMAEDPEHSASDAALWMLLLLRLTTVTADDRLELRNSEYFSLSRSAMHDTNLLKKAPFKPCFGYSMHMATALLQRLGPSA